MIKDLNTERYCIAALLRHKELAADILQFVKESDFCSRLNRSIYGSIIMSFQKGEDISPFSVATRLTNSGQSFDELDGNLVDFLEELSLIQINHEAGLDNFKQLKKISVRREIFNSGEALKREMESAKNKTIEEILAIADKTYGKTLEVFEKHINSEFHNIYEDIQQVIEDRGNNPVSDYGWMGPFKRINEIYGSLVRPGNITLIGARQNVGKSQFGYFYLTDVSIKNNVDIIWADAGEMSALELQMRAVCSLTGGKVPLHMLEEGSWRKNEETTRLVREVWPKIKSLKCHYLNIAGMSPDEIISAFYRCYLTKIGRGNQFIIHYDYLKSFEGYGVNLPEWQQMGYMIQKIKNNITTRLPAHFWTSLQLNRSGIINNKTANQIDNTESTFSISDRIIQQASHAFLLRPKTTEELANEPGLGNMKFFNVKKRHLGKDWQAAINPVAMPDGTQQQNYIMLENRAFVFKEVGDLATLAPSIGQLNHHHHNPNSATQKKSEDEDADLI